MKHIYLLLLLISCAEKPTSGEETFPEVAPKRPSESGQISSDLCLEMKNDTSKDYMVFTKDQNFYVIKIDKLYDINVEEGKTTLSEDVVLDLDGVCSITVSNGLIVLIEVPTHQDQRSPAGHWFW